jgi:hypothetical protein
MGRGTVIGSAQLVNVLRPNLVSLLPGGLAGRGKLALGLPGPLLPNAPRGQEVRSGGMLRE